MQFFNFSELPHDRGSLTNHLGRLNLEIRRRSNVVGIFPSADLFLRRIGSYFLEYQADGATGKAYIRSDRLCLFFANQDKKEVVLAA